MDSCSLDGKTCSACQTGEGFLGDDQVGAFMAMLDGTWTKTPNGKALSRAFQVKGFAKAVYLTNLCAWLADQEGHHPDLRMGWGYVGVTLSSHEAGGLTENDFIWARKLDRLVSGAL